MGTQDSRGERHAIEHLTLIKAHLLDLREICSGLSRAPYSPRSVVMARQGFCDVRMIIEEIMLLSVSAHADAGESVSKGLRNEYHAGKKMAALASINQRFFPEAIDVVPTDEEGIAGRFVSVEDEHLTQAEAARFYVRCGDRLHASWKFVSASAFKEQAAELERFLRLTARLFETFEVDISGRGYMMLGHLNLASPETPSLFSAGVAGPPVAPTL